MGKPVRRLVFALYR